MPGDPIALHQVPLVYECVGLDPFCLRARGGRDIQLRRCDRQTFGATEKAVSPAAVDGLSEKAVLACICSCPLRRPGPPGHLPSPGSTYGPVSADCPVVIGAALAPAVAVLSADCWP